MTFADFRLLAIDLLRDVSLDQPLPSEGAVRVLGVRDTLGLEFDHVFVPGLADTEFPQHYIEHPVLDDSARRALNPAARAVLTEKFAGILERRLLGKILFTTAREGSRRALAVLSGPGSGQSDVCAVVSDPHAEWRGHLPLDLRG